MKKGLILFVLILGFSTLAISQEAGGTETLHMQFKELYITGPIGKFIEQLQEKGYKKESVYNDYTLLSGSFAAADNCFIAAYATPETKTTFMVSVIISPSLNNWQNLKSLYLFYKKLYKDKYPYLSSSEEKFIDPYYEGDGYELQALKLGKCKYFTKYTDVFGVVEIEMSINGSIIITYKDMVNYDKYTKERDNKIKVEI